MLDNEWPIHASTTHGALDNEWLTHVPAIHGALDNEWLMHLLQPRTDVPIPSALFAPPKVQGRNKSCTPQRGESTGRQSRDHY